MAPASPGVLVLIAIQKHPDHDGRELCQEPLEKQVPFCLRESPGAVQDRDDGVGATTQVVLHHLLDQPGALCGRGSTFVAKLETVTPEQAAPKLQDCLLKLLEDEEAPRDGPVGGGLLLVFL